MSDAFKGIDGEMKAFDWYSYPNKLQRMIPVILMAGQQPIEIECFGSISALRETSKQVSFDSA